MTKPEHYMSTQSSWEHVGTSESASTSCPLLKNDGELGRSHLHGNQLFLLLSPSLSLPPWLLPSLLLPSLLPSVTATATVTVVVTVCVCLCRCHCCHHNVAVTTLSVVAAALSLSQLLSPSLSTSEDPTCELMPWVYNSCVAKATTPASFSKRDQEVEPFYDVRTCLQLCGVDWLWLGFNKGLRESVEMVFKHQKAGVDCHVTLGRPPASNLGSTSSSGVVEDGELI